MNVGRLKKLLEGLDDSIDVTLEITTFEDQCASVPLEGLRDDVVGEIVLAGYEKGIT